jgi:hypothetical protein
MRGSPLRGRECIGIPAMNNVVGKAYEPCAPVKA